MLGKVKWFNDKKGYGFITPEDNSKDVFCHYSGIISEKKRKSLEDGDKVSFNIAEGDKGLQAVDVRKV